MELRRIEGVLLQEAILTNLEKETVQKSRELSVKLLSRIPDVIKGMLLNQSIKGRVLEIGREFVLLKLENGEEILVRNALSTGLERGEEVVLQLVSKNPYVLKVITSKKFLRATESLLRNLNNLNGFPLRQIESFKNFTNSGLFYERKLLEAILRKDFSSLYEDAKYQALLNGDKDKLELITTLQLFAMEQGNKKVLLPIQDEEKSGRLLIKKLDRGFKFLFKLSFKEGMLLIEINAPKDAKKLDIKLTSTNPALLEKIGSLEDLSIKIPIGKIEKIIVEEEKIEKIFLRELVEKEVLNLKV